MAYEVPLSVVTEKLLRARNMDMGEGLDDNLTVIKTMTEDEREALAEAEKTLERYAGENAKLKHEAAEKDKMIVTFRRKMKVKDTEIQELRNQVRMLNKELEGWEEIRLGRPKRFTLKGLIKHHFQRYTTSLFEY